MVHVSIKIDNNDMWNKFLKQPVHTLKFLFNRFIIYKFISLGFNYLLLKYVHKTAFTGHQQNTHFFAWTYNSHKLHFLCDLQIKWLYNIYNSIIEVDLIRQFTLVHMKIMQHIYNLSFCCTIWFHLKTYGK